MLVELQVLIQIGFYLSSVNSFMVNNKETIKMKKEQIVKYLSKHPEKAILFTDIAKNNDSAQFAVREIYNSHILPLNGNSGLKGLYHLVKEYRNEAIE